MIMWGFCRLVAMALVLQCALATTTSLRLGHKPSSSSSSSLPLYPVVLIPGIGGNQLEAKLSDDYHGTGLLCRTFGLSYWFRLWLNVFSLIPPFTSCFAERIRLEYNAGTKTFHNPPGIETRVPDFGSTKSMEYLDPTFKFLSAYMNTLVDALKEKGYTSEGNLFGAPYDFRYAPGPNAANVAVQFLKDLKHLIEKASENNNNKQVVLVAHSLGGLWVLHFLHLQSSDWKKKYIARFVAVGTPWGGSVQEMRVFASGYAEGVKFLDPLVLRYEQRSTESNLWLLPVSEVFGNRTLVIGASRSYTAQDLKEFFQDIGFSQGYDHYETRVPGLSGNLSAPGVPVTLIFGTGVDTPETLIYKKSGFDYQPEIRYGDGDGTINLCSLTSVIDNWKEVSEQQLNVVEIRDKTHGSILQEQEAVDQIVEEVFRRVEDAPEGCKDYRTI